MSRINIGEIPAELIRSKRTTVAIEIKPDGTVLVRAPQKMSIANIEKFTRFHERWVKEKLERIEPQGDKLSWEQITALRAQARSAITARVNHYAGIMNLKYGRIFIKQQKSRWGSCSEKGNLNFNFLLVLMPEEILDYVVVHELCHLKEMNHSPAFWAEVEKILPDYKERKKWLKDNGSQYMNKIA